MEIQGSIKNVKCRLMLSVLEFYTEALQLGLINKTNQVPH